jgi:hypothetical protein
MPLQHLTGRHLTAVQDSDLSFANGIVVHHVDDDFACQSVDGELIECTQWRGHHNEIAVRPCLVSGGSPRFWAQLRNLLLKGLRAS